MGKKGAPLRCLSIANMNKKSLLWLLPVLVAGCAHQPPFTPSQGHIDSNQAEKAAVAPGNIPRPVKSAAYLPPPKPKAKEQTYSVVVNDVPVREILFALARESKLNVDIHPGITGNVTLNAEDQTLPAILERISKQIDLTYKVEGNVMSVAPDMPTLRTYKINYVNMERDTASSVGVAAQISSTGSAATTGSTTSSTSPTSGAGTNSSSTTVKSTSKNNFWELLGDNIRIILKTTKSQVASAEEKAARAEAIRHSQEDRLKQVEAVSKAGAGAEKLFQEAFRTQPLSFESKDEVILNPVAGSVTVMATERQHGFIRQYIDSVMASVQRQVLIEATIVEVKLSDGFQAGVDWSRLASDGTKKGFTFAQTLGGAAAATGSQFVLGFSNKKSPLGDLAASIRLLETFGSTKVLSSPKLMAINNQTAILKVVDNIVYFTIDVQSTTNNNIVDRTFTSNVHTVPVGVVMSVTPQVGENGSVILTVRPTISRKVGDAVDPNPALPLNGVQNLIPIIQAREMESVLRMDSGQTAVLGGLMQDDVSNTTDAIPVASKLPILGKLFQGKNDKASKTELVIFLRPTIVANASLESDELKELKKFLPDQLPVVTTDESVN